MENKSMWTIYSDDAKKEKESKILLDDALKKIEELCTENGLVLVDINSNKPRTSWTIAQGASQLEEDEETLPITIVDKIEDIIDEHDIALKITFSNGEIRMTTL